MSSNSAFLSPLWTRSLTTATNSSLTPTQLIPHTTPIRSTPIASSRVILAPGQGAQTLGMAKTWVEKSKAAASIFEQADSQLGDTFQRPLSELIFDSNADAAVLSRTDVAQPAIFTSSIACWAGLQELGFCDKDDLSATAGLSLGEYTALTIADCLKFDDALQLVTLRGRAMQEAAEVSDGGMLALIGADEAIADEVIQSSKGESVLVAANFNAPGQIVLSGASDAIDRAEKFAKEEKKLRVAKLDVAGAFHSPLMQPAADRLAKALNDINIGLPNVPVMSNVTAQPHVVGEIRNMLVQQLTNPVRWAKCCEYLKADPTFGESEWIELAPGKTLTGIMRKIDRRFRIANYSEVPVEAEA